jgi:hypothetical protein
MTCYCCRGELVRAADKPEVRWMRHGDLYCGECTLVIRREQLVDGWPMDRVLCKKHRTPTTKGAT